MGSPDNRFDSITKVKRPAPEIPRMAIVRGYLDASFMGGLEVQILAEVGSSEFDGQLFQVRMMTPFGGQTGNQYTTKRFWG